MSNIRVIIASVLLGIAAFVSYFCVGNVMEMRVKKSLNNFPRSIGDWRWVGEAPLDDAAAKKLGVDDYIQYDYVRGSNEALNLYVSYYGTTGTGGKGYHSPRNCMPGSGWDVIDSQPLEIATNSPNPATVKICRMIMQKGVEKQVVFYWYQCRGRIIDSEYMEKVYLVIDSILKHRSDGAFIRIMTPVIEGQQSKAIENLKNFTAQLIPALDEYLPGAN